MAFHFNNWMLYRGAVKAIIPAKEFLLLLSEHNNIYLLHEWKPGNMTYPNGNRV